ncbi:MAG TPA: hypothetical protein VGN96_02255 [Roseococcus sp.]|jgi:hypothetical protein|nr:hypothetical protein [Roseococcus sp.]
MTESIIQELAREALSTTAPLSDLLRKAKAIAFKLDLDESHDWLSHELNGYSGNDVPEYRIIHGNARFRNPAYGWMPVVFSDLNHQNQICLTKFSQSIRELEHLASGDGEITLQLPGSTIQQLCRNANLPLVPINLFFSQGSVLHILDTVRTRLVDWALALDKIGVRGEGLSFSVKEKTVAQNTNIYNINQIGTFTGNLGGDAGRDIAVTVANSTFDASTIKSLVEKIRELDGKLGLTADQQQKMREALDVLEENIIQNPKNTSRISEMLRSIKNIAEGAAGNLSATGIVTIISQIIKGY